MLGRREGPRCFSLFPSILKIKLESGLCLSLKDVSLPPPCASKSEKILSRVLWTPGKEGVRGWWPWEGKDQTVKGGVINQDQRQWALAKPQKAVPIVSRIVLLLLCGCLLFPSCSPGSRKKRLHERGIARVWHSWLWRMECRAEAGQGAVDGHRGVSQLLYLEVKGHWPEHRSVEVRVCHPGESDLEPSQKRISKQS